MKLHRLKQFPLAYIEQSTHLWKDVDISILNTIAIGIQRSYKKCRTPLRVYEKDNKFYSHEDDLIKLQAIIKILKWSFYPVDLETINLPDFV